VWSQIVTATWRVNMRVYDIALVFIRATVAMDFLRGCVDVVFSVLRVSSFLTADGKAETVGMLVILFAGAASQLLVPLAILWVSKPLARFAAKFADPPAATAPL
jgi:hypothetical protein